MESAIRSIYDEHRSMASVLHGLKHLCRDLHKPGVQPDFEVFRAMIHYIDAFPERLHHPREDKYLFARLLERAPGVRPLIDELQAEHVEGAKLVRGLESALLDLEVNGAPALPAFSALVDRYSDFHWQHMRKEEHELLPLAERVLSAEDWRAIDRAFAANEDPVAAMRERDYEELFTRIANLAPEPVGLGERWERA